MLTLTTSTTSKKINLKFEGAGNVIIYTVPSGKTFKGYFYLSNTTNYYMSINGNSFYFGVLTSGAFGPIPMEFPEGTVITHGNAYGTLMGVES